MVIIPRILPSLALAFLILLNTTLGLGSPAAASDSPSSKDPFKFSGDFRYRHETISSESKQDRHRHRIRLRLTMKAEVNPQVDTFVRLATGIGSPNSTNQDLGSGSTLKQVWLDRAYAVFRAADYCRLWAGKAPLPFSISDLAWDADLNLEGISALIGDGKRAAGFSGGLAGYWISESSSGADQGLLQAFLFKSVGSPEATNLRCTMAYSDYQNLQGNPVVGESNGNSFSSGDFDLYRYDYNLWQPCLVATHKFDNKSLLITGEYLHNSAVGDMGYIVGVTFSVKSVRTPWEAGYNFRSLEPDAALGAFSDSDFAGGGTNARGHRISAAIWPMKRAACRATYYLNTLDPFDGGVALRYQRLMLDFDVSF